MRNFNSHLSDDSESTGLGQTVATIGKMVNNVKELFSGDSYDETAQGELEDGSPSLVKQAGDLAPDGSTKLDVVDLFYKNNATPLGGLREKDNDEPRKVNPVTTTINGVNAAYDNGFTDYNLDLYTLNNYNFLLGAPIYALDPQGMQMTATASFGHLSMFNPLLQMNNYEKAMAGTYHFQDSSFTKNPTAMSRLAESCTVNDLVRNPVGQSRYFYEDFMYCADLGKISNNHLITLRKFPGPIGDNIFGGAAPEEIKTTEGADGATSSEGKNMASATGDIGRMVCYFGGSDNKLEDIIRMSFNATWKEFTGEIQDAETGTDQGNQGSLGVLANLLSPSYMSAFASGRNAGAGIGITGKWGNKLSGEYRRAAYERYDKNRIYTPRNIINKTHQYEGMMNFANSFTLTFRYKMRSFNDVNQKAAFLDLIANILNVTYRRASFWGGSVNWIGTPQNNSVFNTANKIIDKAFDKIGGVWNAVCDGNGGEILQGIGDWLSQLFNSGIQDIMEKGAEAFNNLISSLKSPQAQSFIRGLGNNALNIAKGAVKNRLGRPHVYALNSILSGANVGIWHVTVGNPFNPIVTMGNLIIDKVDFQQSGALNIDDFPEELIVKITLKHAKPRDITAISSMYTRGLGELYTSLGKNSLETFLTKSAKTSTEIEANAYKKATEAEAAAKERREKAEKEAAAEAAKKEDKKGELYTI